MPAVLVRSARLTFLALAAAAGVVTPGFPQPRPSRRPTPLPPIPAVAGPLAVRVVHPAAGALVTARDSTFIFGTVGDGRATLTIDGQPVRVAPNGAFLGFIALPPDSAARLRLVARRDVDSAVLDHPVRLPGRAAPPPGGAWIDAASLEPRGTHWLLPGEPVLVSVRASPGAQVAVLLPGGRLVPLALDTAVTVTQGPFELAPAHRPEGGAARYLGRIPAQPLGGPLPGVMDVAPRGGPDAALLAQLVAIVGADTARELLPLRVALLDSSAAPVAVVGEGVGRALAGHAVAMPSPGGPYHWLLANGTPALVTGRQGDLVRVRLAADHSAWVFRGEVLATLPAGTPPPAARAALVRLVAAQQSVTARVVLSGRVPFRVDEDGDDRLVLTLYSTVSDLDWVQYGSIDSTVRRITWAQQSRDVVTVTFELAAPVFGYRYRWNGTSLELQIRKPPVVDRRRPLRGRVIAIDPGHPPLGATGPTGLREAEANLAVALALRAMLEREGAEVLLTRATDTALGLYERTALAEQADADVLVSIHNNAFPDGVNPFENNGSSTYYYHGRAVRLAVLIQRGLLSEMGLRDIGFGRGDLALVRTTWMPAVLTEGAFLMIPEQEQGLRTPSFQQAYARGVVLGLAGYFRERFSAPR
jgi:N-acetylmuramoyl-L-alanine amidase